MIIACKSCSRKFVVKDTDIPNSGRVVQCGYCSVTWHQMPSSALSKTLKKSNKIKSSVKSSDSSPVNIIKASDGKTYKFMGKQWAQLLPSGKTGLFAKKKIGQELNKLTGRKVKSLNNQKKKKNFLKEVSPSSEDLEDEEKLLDIDKTRKGIGFFGYIFLLIIIGLSITGVLKIFENDVVNYFPEVQYIYEILDLQLEYIAETIKNIIVLLNDLIDSY
jgi:predicted Zn finger-like uncharacterized protein